MKRRNFIAGGLVGLIAPTLPPMIVATPQGLTPEDLRILRAQSRETLALWWCKLNVWGWPKGLPNSEEAIYIRDGRRSQLMHWIQARVPERLRMRTWNYDMNDEEFQVFWRYHQTESSDDRQAWIDMRMQRLPNRRAGRWLDV